MELETIYKCKWLPVKHIEEGWKVLTQEEKQEVKNRVDVLFEGDFIEMKTLPVFYLYIFAFLAQVEVLAVQIPLKFMNKFDDKINLQLRHQLIDEIVHGVVFTKMAYFLAAPLGEPPKIVQEAEDMCDFVRDIEDEKLALICLNLIAEGWIEEVFKEMIEWGVSDKIFKSILSDEERHVSEAELYTKVGIDLLEKSEVESTIRYMEKNLIDALSNGRVTRSFIEACGIRNYKKLKLRLLEKHRHQLKELNLKPSEKWERLTSIDVEENYQQVDKLQELERPFDSYTFCKIWKTPQDPTIRTRFEIPGKVLLQNINSKFIYGVAKFIESKNYSMNLILRNNHKIIKLNTVNLGIRVSVETKNGKEVGTVNLYSVEKMSIVEIERKIFIGIQTLQFWKNKRIENLGEEWYRKNSLRTLDCFTQTAFNFPNINLPVPFTISNIGSLGYTEGFSALTSSNSGDFCVGKLEDKPVWDNVLNQYFPQKYVPIWLSLDHRIFNPHDFNPEEVTHFFGNLDFNQKSQTVDRFIDFEKQKQIFSDATLKNKTKMLEIFSMNTF